MLEGVVVALPFAPAKASEDHKSGESVVACLSEACSGSTSHARREKSRSKHLLLQDKGSTFFTLAV